MSNLSPENQVLERNIDQFPAGDILLLDVMPDDAPLNFASVRQDITWHGFTPFFDTHQFFQTKKFHKFDVSFSAWFDTEQRFDAIVIYYPKAKHRFDYYLSMASKLLNDNGLIYVVGEKKGGIKSCDKGLKPFVIKANKIDSARHCMLYIGASNGVVCPKTMEQWYSSTTLDIEVTGETISLTLFSLPGTFSANRLDDGTELLLKTITSVTGKGLDFGCGCGVISAAVGKRFGTPMTAVDVDALAIASSNKTFEYNNINAKSLASNGLSQLIAKADKFDFIVTNPPFHTGIDTDYNITEQFIQHSKKVLQPKYDFWMVANAFLPYPDVFKHYLKPVDVKSNNKRFNIYHAGTSIN